MKGDRTEGTMEMPWEEHTGLFEKTVRMASGVARYIGMAIVVALVFLTVYHAIARYFFSRPVKGVTDITNYCVVTLIYLLLAQTMLQKEHVRIGLVIDAVKPQARHILELISYCASLVFAIIVPFGTLQLIDSFKMEYSTILHIAKYPFFLILSVSWILLALSIISNMIEECRKYRKGGLGFALAILVIALSVAIMLLHPFNAILKGVPSVTVGVAGLILMVALLFTGTPVAAVMGLVGCFAIVALKGWAAGTTILATIPFASLNNYTWSCIPMYVFMGFLAKNTSLAADFYCGVRMWIGHRKGGLANAIIIGNAAFGACSGDNIAASVTFASISLPETRKYDYDDSFVLATIATSAILASLIPPSMAFIIYGSLTQVSIGKLFIAGIVPGLLLVLMYMIIARLSITREPELAPPVPRVALKDALTSSKGMVFLIIVFLIIIVGIYCGMFTPTEAGALGAFVVMVIGIVRRKLSWQGFLLTLRESAGCLGMIGFMLAGSMIFNKFVALSGLSSAIATAITHMTTNPYVFFILCTLVLGILGCFIDAMPLYLLMVPILFPIACDLDVDPIHFGVLTVVVIMLGAITPPVGILVYSVAGVAKEVPMFSVFRRCLPYVLIMLVFITTIIFIPILSTWLPRLMFE